MKIIDIAARNLCTAKPDDTIDYCAWVMDDRGIRHLPVVRGGRLLGMVSDRDVQLAVGDTVPIERRAEFAGVAAPPGPRTAAELVGRPPVTVTSDASIGCAARIMAAEKIGSLAVVDGGELVGLVTETDLLRAYVDSGWDVDQIGGLVTVGADTGYVLDWMNAPRTVEPSATVDEAWRLMREFRIRHLPVVDGNRLVGMVSDRDLRRAAGRQAVTVGPNAPFGCTEAVAEVMTTDPCTIDSAAALDAAAQRMIRNRIGALPVVEHGRLVGIITETDVLEALAGATA